MKFNPLVFAGFVPAGGGGGGEKGEKGETGAKGEFNYLGAWSNLTTYAKGDAVTEGGTTYASLKAGNLNHKPSELGEWWAVIAEKGAKGETGEKGVKGETGEKGLTGNTGPEGSPKTAKAPLEVVGTEIGLKVGGVIAEYLGAESVETSKIKNKAVTDAKLAGLEWLNVEAVNPKLEQVVTIQVAVFNGLVFMRGTGKLKEEILTKGIYFTVPLAARPSAQRSLLFNNNQGTTTQAANIKTNGEFEVIGANTGNKTPSFDGMVYSL